MRTLAALLLVSSPFLAACQKAHAMDNEQIAHCIAAFSWEREMMIRHSPPRYDLIPPLTAGVAFYRSKLQAAGAADAGKAEFTDFVEKNADNSALMKNTFQECSGSLAKDPEFEKAYPSLLAFALQEDPICKDNASACLKH